MLFYIVHDICLFALYLTLQCILAAPTIVKEIEEGADPEKACEAMKMCTNSSGTVFKYSSCNKLEQVNIIKIRLINIILSPWVLLH